MRLPHQGQARRAFTLIELLVVIAIIAIAMIDSVDPFCCDHQVAQKAASHRQFHDVLHRTLDELSAGKTSQVLTRLDVELQEMTAGVDNRCHFERLRNGRDRLFPNANKGELILIDACDSDTQNRNCTAWSLGYHEGWKDRPGEYVKWVEAMNRIDFSFFDNQFGKLGYQRVQRDHLLLVYNLGDPNRSPTVEGEWTGDAPVNENDLQLHGKDLVAVFATYVNKEKKWIYELTHFARKGKGHRLWSSKLGAKSLIGHEKLSQLDGPLYGEVIAIYARD